MVFWFLGTHGALAGKVLVARVNGAISPVSAKFITEAIEQAETEKAVCLIIELDTPGGLDDSMRVIIKRMLVSKVPVVVYVAPSGSRAASAGAFITIAAHVAAMAPGTAIGAAHPVSLMQSGPMDTNMNAKVTHDAAAYIRSIAEKRGRNIEWAESAVRESVSLSETEALKKKVIDLIAPSTPALLEALDGRNVSIGETSVKLKTKDVQVTEITMNWRDRFLEVIANPNVAYVLFMFGLLGLYFELANPGAIFPGVVGAISLILAFFAFQTLSVNFAGILLIVLGIILFIIDVKAATHGVLTVGGLVAMFIGSLMLFNYDDPAFRVSLRVIIPVMLAVGLFFFLGTWLSIRALTRKPVSGAAGLIGENGDARTAVDFKGGQVFVAGAHWNATAETPIAAGSSIVVKSVNGMTLKVTEEQK
ncbi:MAG: nodulation protein NfeD [Kiritimatiellia bacterium]|nr:nodulation protein NfeD [Kiritimatiellia bacterium]